MVITLGESSTFDVFRWFTCFVLFLEFFTPNPFTWLKEKMAPGKRSEKDSILWFFKGAKCQEFLWNYFNMIYWAFSNSNPGGHHKSFHFCVLISAQFNGVREMLPEKQTNVCDSKLNRKQSLATFCNECQEMTSSLQRDVDLGRTGPSLWAGYCTRCSL